MKKTQFKRCFRLIKFRTCRLNNYSYLQYVYIFKISTHYWYYQFEAIRLVVSRAIAKRKLPARSAYKIKQHTKSKSRYRKKKAIRKILWWGGEFLISSSVKPRGSRMGKGKGLIYLYYYYAVAGTKAFRLANINLCVLKYICLKLSKLLPLCRRLDWYIIATFNYTFLHW